MNRLADASSPYLRLHAADPVDWHVWGPEAREEAARRDVPLFISIGYSTCHWCHVMHHESFADPEIAAQINASFVPIKVDREERPDVDAVYMAAVQATTGQGGWPMSVFATPDGEPFLAGTYWPPEGRHGMPGFVQVLDAVRDAWTSGRDELLAAAGRITAHLRKLGEETVAIEGIDTDLLDTAATACMRAWDETHGGFGSAPKFPHATTIDFLLAHAARTADEAPARAALHSLEAMSRGGIWDLLGGGFARYSTDERWLVPHFEQMLYDNALLLRAVAHGQRHVAATDGDEDLSARLRRVATETAGALLGRFRLPGGAFAAAFDADVDGEEGAYHAWDAAEVREVVAGIGEDADEWARRLGVDAAPTFEGRWVLHEAAPRDETDPAERDRWTRVLGALAARRDTRTPPARDDKVLTSWNGLAIGALAEAGAILDEPGWIAAAEECAGFIASELVVDGRLHHTWRDGHGPSVGALAEDVALLAQGLACLAEATGSGRWLQWAITLLADADVRFAVRDDAGNPTGALAATADDAEQLIARPVDRFDDSTPAPAGALAEARLRLAALTGDADHRDAATAGLRSALGMAERAPLAAGEALRAATRLHSESVEVAVIGKVGDPETRALLGAARMAPHPGAVVVPGTGDGAIPLLEGRRLVEGRPAAYVCHDHVCEAPVTDPDRVKEMLRLPIRN